VLFGDRLLGVADNRVGTTDGLGLFRVIPDIYCDPSGSLSNLRLAMAVEVVALRAA
jgi:hypothetical protein